MTDASTQNTARPFLRHVIWPRIIDVHLVHDANCCETHPYSVRLLTRRPDNFEHVGQVFEMGACDIPTSSHSRILRLLLCVAERRIGSTDRVGASSKKVEATDNDLVAF